MGKKIALRLFNVLNVAIIILAALLCWTVIVTPKGEAPSVFGHTFMTVLTGSMAPEIVEDTFIIVRKEGAEKIALGDIISFYTNISGVEGVINTHRVVNIESDGTHYTIYTKGDANPLMDDATVNEDQLIGRVIFHSHPIGVALSLLRNKIVFLIIVLVPLLLILGNSVLHLVRLARKEIAQAGEEIEQERRQLEQEAESASTHKPGEENGRDG